MTDSLTNRITVFAGRTRAGKPVSVRKESTWLGSAWSKAAATRHPTHLVISEPEFASFSDFSRELKDVVQSDADVGFIFAAPTEETRQEAQGGNQIARKGGFDPTVERHIVPLDLDDVPFPSKYDLFEDVEQILYWIRDDMMPPEFIDVPMAAIITSSAGLHTQDRISARLFFWSNTPVSAKQMRQYVRNRLNPWCRMRDWSDIAQPFDTSIYSAGQPIYIMPPTLNGRPDPWQRRHYDIEGLEDGVDIEIPEIPELMPGEASEDELGERLPGSVWSWVRHIPTLGAHAVILEMTWRLARITPQSRVEQTLLQLEETVQLALRLDKNRPGEGEARVQRHATREKLRAAFFSAREKIRAIPTVQGKIKPRDDIAKSRQRLKLSIQYSVHRSISGDNAHKLALVDVGGGKTQTALEALTIDILRDNRIDYLVPNHTLAESVISDRNRLMKDGATVRHHEGRARLCKSEEWGPVAEMAERVGRSPYGVACKHCPLHDTCAWVAQRNYKGNGLVISTHAHMITSYQHMVDHKTNKPAEHAPKLIIVDEAPYSTFLDDQHTTRSLDSIDLTTPEMVAPYLEGIDVGTLAKIVNEGRGAIKSSLIGKRGILAVSQFEALEPLWIDSIIGHEYILRKAIQKALDTALEKRNVGAVAILGNMLRGCQWALSFYDALKSSRKIERPWVFGVRADMSKAKVFLRRKLPALMKSCGVLWLDATGDEAMMRRIIGRDVHLGTIKAQITPGPYRAIQHVDATFSKAHLLRNFSEKEAAIVTEAEEGDRWSERPASKAIKRRIRADSNARRLHGAICRLLAGVRMAGVGASVERLDADNKPTGETDIVRVAVVAQLAIRKQLEDIGLPDDVRVMHYNSVRGLNWVKDVPALVVVGRPWQGHESAECAYEALTYDDPNVVSYTQATGPTMVKRAVEMADGTFRQIDVEGHPDEGVSTLFRVTAAAEVQQAVGRARLVNRTKDNPAFILVFGQVDIGVPVHELRHWVDVERSYKEIQDDAGVFFRSAQQFEIAFPGLVAADRKASRAGALLREVFEVATTSYVCRSIIDNRFEANDSVDDTNANIVPFRAPGGEKIPYNGSAYIRCTNNQENTTSDGKNATKSGGWTRFGLTIAKTEGRKRQLVHGEVLIDTERHEDPRLAIERVLNARRRSGVEVVRLTPPKKIAADEKKLWPMVDESFNKIAGK